MRRDASVLATGALLGSLFFAALALVACPAPEPFHPTVAPATCCMECEIGVEITDAGTEDDAGIWHYPSRPIQPNCHWVDHPEIKPGLPVDPPPHALADELRATNAALDDVDRLVRLARAADGGAGGRR